MTSAFGSGLRGRRPPDWQLDGIVLAFAFAFYSTKGSKRRITGE